MATNFFLNSKPNLLKCLCCNEGIVGSKNHEKFSAVHRKFSAVHRKFSAVHGKFSAVHEKFSAVHGMLSVVQKKFCAVCF
jgi:hypothetical protein